jgi:hypothetical protein
VKHPRFPLEKTVANFWLDDIGIGDGSFRVYDGKEFPEIFGYINERLEPPLRGKGEARFYPLTPFSQYGVPNLFPETSAAQPFNHTPWDRASLLSVKAMQTIGQYALEATLILANAPAGIIEKDRFSRFAVRSTPIFSLSPLQLEDLRSSKDSTFRQETQRSGPVVFFAQLDIDAPSLLDSLALVHDLQDSSGRKVQVALSSNFPRTFGGESDSAVVMTADAVSLFRHSRWVPLLRDLGLGAIVIRGQGGQLPTGLTSSDGALRPEAIAVLQDFPLLAIDLLPEAAKELLPRTLPFVLIGPSEWRSKASPHDIVELRALAQSGALFGIQFPCSMGAQNNGTAEWVAREVVEMKQLVGVGHILLNPEISQNSSATTLQSVVEALQTSGWELDEIRRVLGGNLADAWRETARH